LVLALPECPVDLADPVDRSQTRYKVVLYSLDTDATRRAKEILLGIYPNLRVDTCAAEVNDKRLEAMVRAADIVVFAWKVSTHPAFYSIKAAVGEATRVVMATGSGTSSLVQAVNDSIVNEAADYLLCGSRA
jgi:hypothetical protein